MAKRPLTAAELAQRRAAAVNAGRPAKPWSRRGVAAAAKARAGRARARELIGGVQVEATRILIAAMRGQLPNSTGDTMKDAAKALLTKGGTDAPKNIALLDKRPAAPVKLHLKVSTEAYPPATEPEEHPDADGDGRPPLAH